MQNLTTALFATLALTACGPQSWLVAPAPAAAQEFEPNNSLWSANDFGLLGAGDSLTIAGHVDSGGFGDVYDGFEFTATSALAVQFTLTAQSPGADLDLALVDPWTQATVWEFQSPSNPEVGGFDVFGSPLFPKPFQLVVTSFTGSSNYLLHIQASPVSGGLDTPKGTLAPAISDAPDSTGVPAAPPRTGAFQGYLEPAAEGGSGDASASPPAEIARGLLLELDADGEVTGIAEVVLVDQMLLAGDVTNPWRSAED